MKPRELVNRFTAAIRNEHQDAWELGNEIMRRLELADELALALQPLEKWLQENKAR